MNKQSLPGFSRSIVLWVAAISLILAASLYVRSWAATEHCPDISPLPCEAVKVLPDKVFTFDGGDGGLADRNGASIGFTMVDPPAAPGNPSPDPYAPGYWADKLELTNGRLSIATTPGIAHQANNSQDNALGIGLDLGSPLYLQTTIVDLPAPPSGSAQAGLWFGKSDVGPSGLGGTGTSQDNYIKLVVIATSTSEWHVQIAWEQNGVVSSYATPVGKPDAVALNLAFDPAEHTITGRYCTTPACDPRLAPIFRTFSNVPVEWFSSDQAGIDLNVGTRSMGGIFGTRRSAASAVTFQFDNFYYHLLTAPGPLASKDGIDFDVWTAASIDKVTGMAWGPDGRLYASTVTGQIYAYQLDFAARQAVLVQTINAVQWRLTLGLTVDPASTPSNVILWVAHSDLSQANGAANSGTVTRLSGANFATRQDVITGLPRAVANHATNNLRFGADGRLYIAQGGNTGAGGSNDQPTEFSTRPEQPLSAAILVADVKAPGFDGSCASEIDPSGAQMDATGISARDVPCDVQVFGAGLRNPYDFVFHTNGEMYATENGLGILASYPPLYPNPLDWNPAAGCEGMTVGLANTVAVSPGDRPDLLQRIVPGGYYGHPNPSRDQCIFFGGNPTAGQDFPVHTTSETTANDYLETTKYPVGRQPDPNWRQPMFSFGRNKSANGIIEYRSDGEAFCGRLDGELLVTYFAQSDQVRRVRLSADGLSVVSDSRLIRTSPGAGGPLLVDPLPIVQGPGGRIFVGEFSNNGRITVFEPVNVGTWETNGPAELPAAILDAGSAVLDGRLYAVGGKTSVEHLRTLYAFNPANSTWQPLADLPAAYPAVENPAVVAHAGKLYVFGGSTSAFSGSVVKAARYDPAANAWSMLPDMPTPRGGAAAQVLGGKIYVAGGMNAGASLATLESFDLSSQTWSSETGMATQRDNPGAAVVNGKLYVFGGRTRLGGTELEPTLNTVEVFTPGQGWSAAADMPTGRRAMAVVVMNGEALVLGGERTPTGGAFVANEAYNPATNTWRLLTDMPVGRHGMIAGLIGGTIYVAGGGTTGGSSFTTDMDTFRFDCGPETPAPDLAIAKSHSGNFNQGQQGAQYSLTITNRGTAAASGTVTVADALPDGLAAAAISGSGWNCSLASLTCTRTDALAAGASYPPITLAVNVAANAPAQVINTAVVTGGGDSTPANNTASDLTFINLISAPQPDLVIAKSHSGDFVQGQGGGQYSLVVTNQGNAAASAAVTVADSLPAGLTAAAISGAGWNCSLAGLTCTRSDTLAAGASYPPILLTVTVAADTAPVVVNTASVSGGGDANLANNTASDPTNIVQGDLNQTFFLPLVSR